MKPSSRPENTKFLIYQLFVRHFGNDKPKTIPGGSKKENGCGTFDDLTLPAIQTLKELGTDYIWLTGIVRHATQTDYSTLGIPPNHPDTVKGKAGSPYAVTDFFDLDPDLAKKPADRWKSFENCCQRIHSEGLKVLIDFIPNHTARQYQSPTARKMGLRDLGQNDFTHEYFHPNNHYYYIPDQALVLPKKEEHLPPSNYLEYPAKATGNDCFTAHPSLFDWFETTKLNYGRNYHNQMNFFNPIPATWLYMKEVLRFWAGKGIDGFRCDMVELVPVDFWAWAIAGLKEEFPHLLFVAEVYNADLYRSYTGHGGFDYLYDKVGLYDELRALIEEKGSANRIPAVWQNQEGLSEKMLRFLENHDEQRIASEQTGKDPFRALPAFAIAALMGKGPVMLYSGQEFGEKASGAEGFSGDDGKTSIFDYTVVPTLRQWNQKGKWKIEGLPEIQQKLWRQYRSLIQFAKGSDAIRCGSFYDLQYANQYSSAYQSDRVYSFLRHQPNEKYLVVCSFLPEKEWIRVQIPPDAWYHLGIPTDKRCRLEDVLDQSPPVEFYIKASFQGDGGSAGVLIPVDGFGYRIFSLVLLD